MSVLIFGCGYVGHRAARAWHESGTSVAVVTRLGDRADALAQEGFQSIIADVTRPETLGQLPAARTVLFAVGYDRRQSLSIRETYAGGLQHVLDRLSPETLRIIYVSSTGVYGDAGGDWIDEGTRPEPARDGGRACLAAEQVLFDHDLGNRGVVLRLAGIYGPGRIPRRDDLLSGMPIAGNADGNLNLIHVDDAVQAILAAAVQARSPRIYNVSDGNPAPRRSYYEELARLLAAPAFRFSDAEGESSERSRGGADKRVSNARMLSELGVTLRYPSFREGLAAIVQSS